MKTSHEKELEAVKQELRESRNEFRADMNEMKTLFRENQNYNNNRGSGYENRENRDNNNNNANLVPLGQRNQNNNQNRRRIWKCQNCLDNNVWRCTHCWNCGGDDHKAAACPGRVPAAENH